MTVQEFQDYWLHQHVDVIRRLPGIRRYVQNHLLPENYARGEPLHDGVAELWADDTNAFRNMAADPAYTDVLDDEDAFLDRKYLNLVMTSEHIVNDGKVPAVAIKLLEFYRRNPDITVEDFQHYWHDVHGPLVNRLTAPRRYVQSTARPGGYAGGRFPVYDALSSTWFDSTDDLDLVLNSDQYADIMKEWENFIDVKVSITCKEYVLIG